MLSDTQWEFRVTSLSQLDSLDGGGVLAHWPRAIRYYTCGRSNATAKRDVDHDVDEFTEELQIHHKCTSLQGERQENDVIWLASLPVRRCPLG
jgi:hypothetical protein